MTQSMRLKHPGESRNGCRTTARVKPNIFPAQPPLPDSGQNRCPGKAEGMGEAQPTPKYSPRRQQFVAYTFSEPEQCLYLRLFNVVLFLLPPLRPCLLLPAHGLAFSNHSILSRSCCSLITHCLKKASVFLF